MKIAALLAVLGGIALLAGRPSRPVHLRAPPPKPLGSEQDSEPRLFVLAINGGGSASENYFSHLLHLRELVALLHSAGIPGDRITVLAGDGSDPTPDLVLREEGLGAEGWRLSGTPVEGYFPPRAILGNSEVTGAKLYPATKGSLSIWLMTVGQQLRAGDTVLLYVTDHGTWGADPDGNRIVLWGPGQTLSARELREALETLDRSLRVVALMSQCYSGGFAKLANLGDSADKPTGRFCGFFSTTENRKSYGSYPETRDDPKVGYSFAFLKALPAAAGSFTRAHEMSLELDDTPDVPVRSSDLYVGAQLEEEARTRGVPLGELVDGLLGQSSLEDGGLADSARLLEGVSRRFGLGVATNRRAAVATVAASLQGLPALLAELAGDLTRSLGEINAGQFRQFLVSRPEWEAPIETATLQAMDPAERIVLGNKLTSDLALFSRNADSERAERSEAVQHERVRLRQLAFRMRVRLAALTRMENMLDSIAGQVYLASHPRQQALWKRLVDCETLDLGLPEAEWAEPAAAFPPVDDDIAETTRIVKWATERDLLRPRPVWPSQSAPELELTAYRGDIPIAGSGKPILLFFWATSCQLCVNVASEVADIARRKGMALLAITDETEATLDRFLEQHREFPWSIGRDPGRQVTSRFGIRDVPTFVLIDGQGKIGSLWDGVRGHR